MKRWRGELVGRSWVRLDGDRDAARLEKFLCAAKFCGWRPRHVPRSRKSQPSTANCELDHSEPTVLVRARPVAPNQRPKIAHSPSTLLTRLMKRAPALLRFQNPGSDTFIGRSHVYKTGQQHACPPFRLCPANSSSHAGSLFYPQDCVEGPDVVRGCMSQWARG